MTETKRSPPEHDEAARLVERWRASEPEDTANIVDPYKQGFAVAKQACARELEAALALRGKGDAPSRYDGLTCRRVGGTDDHPIFECRFVDAPAAEGARNELSADADDPIYWNGKYLGTRGELRAALYASPTSISGDAEKGEGVDDAAADEFLDRYQVGGAPIPAAPSVVTEVLRDAVKDMARCDGPNAVTDDAQPYCHACGALDADDNGHGDRCWVPRAEAALQSALSGGKG